ncbi:MAG: DUF2147 domain-containing protein [Thermoanaerobaculum sp.]|nr:DUF2147 domain-containing protein [Thermoanaerobaculum sp.]MDW7968537.1 DUF2147 domain-containing protein [Thermoanaerobaculum sp.]
MRWWVGLSVAVRLAGAADPHAVVGLWQTPPDPQEGCAIVELVLQGTGLLGRIVWLEKPFYPAGSAQAGEAKVDRQNPDPRLRQRPILGLPILWGFRWEGGRWVDGSVYDPVSGKTYRATLSLEGAHRLRLRGFVGVPLLGRTEVWTRVEKIPSDQGAGLFPPPP